VVIETVTESMNRPPWGENTGVAVFTVGSETVNVKPVVFTTVSAVPVTVIEYAPAGVSEDVLIVRTVEQVGEHESGEKDAVAPSGSPAAENVTPCVSPETILLLMVFWTGIPLTTDLSPPLESVKSKALVLV
jgi:hypothetical protein